MQNSLKVFFVFLGLVFFTMAWAKSEKNVLSKSYQEKVVLLESLIVPENATACALRVGDQTRHWEEGKVMVFDDSYDHEAWNKSDERRAVLMFDIANPEMGYTADQICRYKLSNVQDPFMLGIAPAEKWMEWYEQGHFPQDLA